MIQLNLHEAKAKLSECIDAALRGERVVIARRNVPAVELAPIPQHSAQPRKIGQGPKQPGYTLPDAFWEPLPNDLVAAFKGGRLRRPVLIRAARCHEAHHRYLHLPLAGKRRGEAVGHRDCPGRGQ